MKAAAEWYGMCQVVAAVHASLTPLAEVMHKNVGDYPATRVRQSGFQGSSYGSPPQPDARYPFSLDGDADEWLIR